MLKIVVLFIGTFLGAGLALMVFDRELPVRVISRNVDTPIVKRGSVLQVSYRIEKLRDCAVHADRYLIDENNLAVALPDVDDERSPYNMGYNELARPIMIPPVGLKAGRVVLKTLPSYRCNIFHKWFWPITAEPSEIAFTLVD